MANISISLPRSILVGQSKSTKDDGFIKISTDVGTPSANQEPGKFEPDKSFCWMRLETSGHFSFDNLSIHGTLDQLESIAEALLHDCQWLRQKLTVPAESEVDTSNKVELREPAVA